MGRIVALDYGKIRTGVAVTDPLKLIASGLTTVETTGLLKFLREYTSEEEIDLFVIGEPKQMNNMPSESEVLILTFIKKLKATFPDIPIARQDERFTSKMAAQTLLDSGVRQKYRRNRALVDEISATLILQAYLDRTV